ncbi:MAG TPA: META domain-containing protein [Casimicrobiaceae bacterium]|nr:META domain-containing protein [Casimicrobiaceae bacterium]
MRVRKLLVFGVLGLLTSRGVAISPFPLIGTMWAWHATAGDAAARPVAEPNRYTIELAPDGVIRVRADCNRGSGRYQANDVELTFGPIATTKMSCPDGSRDREFLDALGRVDRYRFEGTDLLLLTRDGKTALRFRSIG